MPSFRTLRANFLAIHLPLILASFVVISGIFEWLSYNTAHSKLREKLSLLSASQSIILAEAVARVDRDNVRLIVASAIADPDVAGIAVYDRHNNTLDSYGFDGTRNSGLFERTSITYVNDERPAVVGQLDILLTDKRLREELVQRLSYEAVILFFLLLFAVFSAGLAQRSTVGIPIKRLLGSIQRQDDKPDYDPVLWNSSDEMGRFVAAYNLMRLKQVGYETDLRTARDELRQRVQELSDANARLVQEMATRRRAEQQLEYLAHHDALTDLPNRYLLHARLEQAMERMRRYKKHLAILFIDLDRFKNLNDSFGHQFGDQLLRATAAKLTSHLRAQDFLARLGGDEFVILVEDLHRPKDASVIAEKILGAFTDALKVFDRNVFITASIGISVCPQDGTTLNDLIKNADTAMYRMKERGRNGFYFYTPQLSRAAVERYSLEADLRGALDQGQLELYYQPQHSARTGEVVGAEALIRWRHPRRGLTRPDRFIPLAEDTNLIIPIGTWVLNSACCQWRSWQNAGLPPVRIAVNVSREQIMQEGLVSTVEQVIEESDLEPKYLELEVTEGLLMRQPEKNIETLQALRALGVTLAIDDFGAGYSSLSYLRRLPIQKLKIDRAFVREIPTDSNDEAIARAIIALGHSLGMSITAEGVETDRQLAFLVEEGCDEVQGYLSSPPLPADEFADFLRGGHRVT